jgi:HSP20 family protein
LQCRLAQAVEQHIGHRGQPQAQLVRAEVPSVAKKDIEVSVNETSVSIKGKVMREAKKEKGDYYRCEIGSGEFSRTSALPCAVDATKAKAQLKDGLLKLTLRKVEKAKRHTITIA